MKQVWPLLAVLVVSEAGASVGSITAGWKPATLAQSEMEHDRQVWVEDPFRMVAVPASRQLRLAHAILVKALPDKESVISDAPTEVLLTFNEGVGEEFLALAVVDASGKRVDKHDAHQDFTDRSHLRASVETLVPGRYMVRYRVLSADGHVVSGKYFFEVKPK